MSRIWKPNTTIHIPIDLLDRINIFLSDNSEQFLNNQKRCSRNMLIEKALTYYMNNWEEIKKAA